MNNMHLLSVGDYYQFPLGSEGATANFLTTSGNTLQLAIPNISKTELFALKKGKIKAGFLYKKGDLLWLFEFFDKKGKAFTLDCPFDARLIPKNLLALHDITNASQRLAIDIHVVDEKNIIRALRSVTMPNALTLEFLCCAQDQLLEIRTGLAFEQWLSVSPDNLAKSTKMYRLGE